MKRFLLTLLCVLGLAGAATPSTEVLCRVTATSTPAWFGSSFSTIEVKLDDNCPANGVARIQLGGYGAIGSTAYGRIEPLSPRRPVLRFVGQPGWRTLFWRAKSGKRWPVTIRRLL